MYKDVKILKIPYGKKWKKKKEQLLRASVKVPCPAPRPLRSPTWNSQSMLRYVPAPAMLLLLHIFSHTLELSSYIPRVYANTWLLHHHAMDLWGWGRLTTVARTIQRCWTNHKGLSMLD